MIPWLDHPTLGWVRTFAVLLLALAATWSQVAAIRTDLRRPSPAGVYTWAVSAVTIVLWWIVLSLAWGARWR